MSAPDVEVIPVTGVIGAEIRGMDLSRPLSAEDRELVEASLLRHLVLFFRDQDLTDEDQRAFAQQFGPVEPYVLAPPANPEVPEVHTSGFDDGAAAKGSHTDSWHTDGSYMERPPLATVLRAVVLPPYGGDTCWANMYAAYDALSPVVQQMLDGLVAVHDFAKISFTTFDGSADPEGELRTVRRRYPPMRHPVVRTHPVSGRKLLYVHRNYTTRIEGLTERENEVLLPFLCDHVRDPLFQCRFLWTAGAVAFWDNRATQHYAVPDYDGTRLMHRVVVSGDQPR